MAERCGFEADEGVDCCGRYCGGGEYGLSGCCVYVAGELIFQSLIVKDGRSENVLLIFEDVEKQAPHADFAVNVSFTTFIPAGFIRNSPGSCDCGSEGRVE